MNTKLRARSHADRLARRTLRGAGPLAAVGRQIDRATSTVGHYVTDRPDPRLVVAFEVLLSLSTPPTTAQAFLEAAREAVELREIKEAATDVLVGRGVFLLRHECEVNAQADEAAQQGRGLAEALTDQAAVSTELAAILAELGLRGVDLLQRYRGTK